MRVMWPVKKFKKNILQIVYDNATLAMQDEVRQAAINAAKFKAVATRLIFNGIIHK